MSHTAATIDAEASLSPRRHAFARARRWGALLAKFVSVQLIVQAIGLVSGLLLIRTLSQREYAYFTLANTMQATLLLLADVGVSSALSATGGRVWQDKTRFSELIATGLHVRKRLAWVGGGIALPVLCGMLIRNGTGPVYAALLAVAVLLGASYRLTGDVLTMVPRLHGRINQLQKLDLYSSVFRLALIGAACLTFVNAAVGILVASLSFGVQYVLLKRWTAGAIDTQASTNAEDKQTIVRVVKQQAPNTIFFCVQSQLMVFIISLFGNTKTIAEIGALGRLSMLFSIVGSVMTSIVLPKFSKCHVKVELKRLYWQIISSFGLLSLILVSIAAIFPRPLLWLLGRSYGHLQNELLYVVAGNVLGAFVGLFYSLNTSRAWIKGMWLSIPIIIVTQLVLIGFLDLSKIKDVVILSSLPPVLGLTPIFYRAYEALKSSR